MLVTGTVNTVEVTKSATGTTLDVAKGATVGQLDNSTTMTTSGEGKVNLTIGTGTVTRRDGSSSSGISSGGSPSGGSSSGDSSPAKVTKIERDLQVVMVRFQARGRLPMQHS